MTDFEHTERMHCGDKTEFLKDRAIFALALGQQTELDTHEFNSYEQAEWAARVAADELNTRLYRDTLRKEVIALSGSEVVMPIAKAELSGFVGLQIDTPPESTLASLPKVGHFHGFTSFVTYKDQDKRYRAVLGYQANMGWIEAPSFSGDLIAYGPVDSSILEFINDRKAKDTTDAKNNLLGVVGPALDELVFKIDAILGGKDYYDAQELHRVALLIRDHLKSYDQPLEEATKDALLDLVKSKLGLYDDLPFTLEVDATAVATTEQPSENYNDSGNLSVKLPILGVVFSPYSWFEDGLQVDSEQDAVSLIISLVDIHDKPQLYAIPFELIRRLEPDLK